MTLSPTTFESSVSKEGKIIYDVVGFLPREMIGSPSLETSKIVVEKNQVLPVGTPHRWQRAGGWWVMFFFCILFDYRCCYHTQIFFVRFLSYLKVPVSRQTARERHLSALHVCPLVTGRLPASRDTLLSLLQTVWFIKRCNSVSIGSEFTSYIFFRQKAKTISPKYMLPFGAICQMGTETLKDWNHLGCTEFSDPFFPPGQKASKIKSNQTIWYSNLLLHFFMPFLHIHIYIV